MNFKYCSSDRFSELGNGVHRYIANWFGEGKPQQMPNEAYSLHSQQLFKIYAGISGTFSSFLQVGLLESYKE